MDKIVCIGKNYLDHAKELGDAVPEMPVLFLKPESSLVVAKQNRTQIELPHPQSLGSLHHECEIVVRINRGGSHLSLAEAASSIGAVTLGLDMTLRDLQATLKKNGHPWETSKVFAGAACVGAWINPRDFPNFESTEFSFSLNGAIKQKGTAKQMRLSIAECIAYASRFFPLMEGDLFFTGTPAGVGAVEIGSVGKLTWGEHLQYDVKWV